MTTEVLLEINVHVTIEVLAALEVSFAFSHVSFSEIWGRSKIVFVFIERYQSAFITQWGGCWFVQSVVNFRLAYLTQGQGAPPKTVCCWKRTFVVEELVFGLANKAFICVQVSFHAVVSVGSSSQYASIVHLIQVIVYFAFKALES